ncbi:uncharacterized protein ACNS7B_023123 [Menidia menidia]
MRGLALLCLFGYALVEAIDLRDVRDGVTSGLEGRNMTLNAQMDPPPNKNDTSEQVKWNGTWVSIESSAGFPPAKKEDKWSQLFGVRIAPPESKPKKEPAKEVRVMGHWSPLDNGFGFPTPSPEEKAKKEK